MINNPPVPYNGTRNESKLLKYIRIISWANLIIGWLGGAGFATEFQNPIFAFWGIKRNLVGLLGIIVFCLFCFGIFYTYVPLGIILPFTIMITTQTTAGSSAKVTTKLWVYRERYM